MDLQSFVIMYYIWTLAEEKVTLRKLQRFVIINHIVYAKMPKREEVLFEKSFKFLLSNFGCLKCDLSPINKISTRV